MSRDQVTKRDSAAVPVQPSAAPKPQADRSAESKDGDPARGGVERGVRLTVFGLFVNAGLAILKLTAGLAGHSYALVADAVESMADVFSSVVVISGLRISSRPPDEDHPYGHGKAEPLSALIVTAMLVAAGVGIAIEAIQAVITPRPAPAGFTLWVLLFVVVVKEGLYRIVRRAARSIGSVAMSADAWHHRSDAITSVTAAIGISIAYFGGEGYESADAWAAMLASCVILFNAFKLMSAPLHELMDAVPKGVVDQARCVAGDVPGVLGVEKVFARKSGMAYWVDMHVETDPEMSVLKAHALAHEVKEAVQSAMPKVFDVLVHIEPYGRESAPQGAPSTAPSNGSGC